MKKKTEEEKYSVFRFTIREKGREIFNTWTWEKKLDENNKPTDEDDITIKLLMEKFWSIMPSKEQFSDRKKKLLHQKSAARGNNRWLHHRIEEFIADLWVPRHLRWTDTVQAGWQNRIKASERCAATEGVKSQLRESYWHIQSRWSYKKETATDASTEKNWKVNKKKTTFYEKKIDRNSKDPEGTSEGGKDEKTRNADSVVEYTD